MEEGPHKKANGPTQPALKIIEEEEVLRLEADPAGAGEKDSGPKKRISLRREDRLPTATKEEMTVPNEAVDGIDVSESQQALRFPPILIAFVALIFVSLLGLGVFLVVGTRKEDATDNLVVFVQDRKDEQEAEAREARQILKKMTETLTGYSRATTVEERLPYVRHPDRVRPLMERYYETHPFDTLRDVSLVEQYPIPLGSRSFTLLTIVGENSQKRVHLAEVDNDLDVKIDWESDVCYQPRPVSQLVAERPTEAFDLRVFAIPDNLYAYEFADSAKYQCLKLTVRDSEDYFFGYVEKGSEAFQKLFEYYRHIANSGPVQPSPMILSIRFLPEGRGENLVVIDEFVAPRWAFLDNPADE